jgi:hypothetical protein
MMTVLPGGLSEYTRRPIFVSVSVHYVTEANHIYYYYLLYKTVFPQPFIFLTTHTIFNIFHKLTSHQF